MSGELTANALPHVELLGYCLHSRTSNDLGRRLRSDGSNVGGQDPRQQQGGCASNASLAMSTGQMLRSYDVLRGLLGIEESETLLTSSLPDYRLPLVSASLTLPPDRLRGHHSTHKAHVWLPSKAYYFVVRPHLRLQPHCWAAFCEHLARAMPPVCYTSVHPTNISPGTVA